MKLLQMTRRALYGLKHRKYFGIQRQFESYTMVPQLKYVANLALAAQARSLQGAIVECGTWKGGMIAGMAKLLGPERNYYLFDSFEGLPPVEAIDGQAAQQWAKNTDSPHYADNCKASEDDASAAMFQANIHNPTIVKGWFENTLHTVKFTEGIAILRMDADWYKSTTQILDALFPAVNAGGLILIDDYYTWDGCSKAIHDYLSKHERPERINNSNGVCFIKKMHVTDEAILTS